ncbi:MAG: hypothetical protein RMN25_05535 [Anaerolineae bacterium]|nr:hypothetical protein [Thermoflexales bacterium]MDW8407228.1 hypothetical protein [Anaerolineae bacterium]
MRQYLDQLPIRTIDFNTPADAAPHEQMVSWVTQMLEAKRRLATAPSEHERRFYSPRCHTLDQEIDALVYELYDLTAENIAPVEGR